MSRGEAMPPDVRRLIADHVHSVGALDLLLLLRDDPDRWWSARDVARTIRCPVAWAERELERLSRGALVAASGDGDSFAFRPADAALARAVETLSRFYVSHAREIVGLILAVPVSGRDR